MPPLGVSEHPYMDEGGIEAQIVADRATEPREWRTVDPVCWSCQTNPVPTVEDFCGPCRTARHKADS